jgi:hypothetical protein
LFHHENERCSPGDRLGVLTVAAQQIQRFVERSDRPIVKRWQLRSLARRPRSTR